MCHLDTFFVACTACEALKKYASLRSLVDVRNIFWNCLGKIAPKIQPKHAEVKMLQWRTRFEEMTITLTNCFQSEGLINRLNVDVLVICQLLQMLDKIIGNFVNGLQHGFQLSGSKSWTQDFSQRSPDFSSRCVQGHLGWGAVM